MKIGIIGSGSMGSAMVKGFYKSQHLNMNELYIKSGESNKAKVLAESVNANIIYDYEDMINCEMIILMVNKNSVNPILKDLSYIIKKQTMIVSVIPTRSIEEIESFFSKEQPIVTLLPNTVVEINQGILGYACNQNVNDKVISYVFSPLGKVIQLEEEQLEVFSIISGCGPAILDLFIEGLSDGAVLNGMNRALSYEVITEMIIGSAKLAKESGKHPGALKDEVTSPGGTTTKAIYTLEKHAFRYTLSDAINTVNGTNL